MDLETWVIPKDVYGIACYKRSVLSKEDNSISPSTRKNSSIIYIFAEAKNLKSADEVKKDPSRYPISIVEDINAGRFDGLAKTRIKNKWVGFGGRDGGNITVLDPQTRQEVWPNPTDVKPATAPAEQRGRANKNIPGLTGIEFP